MVYTHAESEEINDFLWEIKIILDIKYAFFKKKHSSQSTSVKKDIGVFGTEFNEFLLGF